MFVFEKNFEFNILLHPFCEFWNMVNVSSAEKEDSLKISVPSMILNYI